MIHASNTQRKVYRQACQTRVTSRVCDALHNQSKAGLRDLLKDAAANTAAIKTDDEPRAA